MDKGKKNLLNIKLYLEYYKKDINNKYLKVIENIVVDNDVLNILNEQIHITTLDKHNKLQQENNTLTKGIDKTIEEIEFEINNNFVVGGTYNRLNCLLQDLKKLKGE